MYAIVKTGNDSKQYQVEKGDRIEVELLDAQEGDLIDIKDVLLVASVGGAVHIGRPTVSGYVVKAQVVGEVKGPKVFGVKYKRRKNNYRKFGHRQRYHQLQILDIVG